MTETATLTRVTRRTALRRVGASFELLDGRTVTGTLIGWGSYVVTFAPSDEARAEGWSWKSHALPVGQVASVRQVR